MGEENNGKSKHSCAMWNGVSPKLGLDAMNGVSLNADRCGDQQLPDQTCLTYKYKQGEE